MRIVSFGQMVDVATKQFTYQMVVITDDGHSHAITTTEDTIQQLVGKLTNGGVAQENYAARSAEPYVSPVRKEYVQESEDEELASIFGGEPDPGEQAQEPEPVMGVIAEDRVAEEEEAPRGLGSRPSASRIAPPTRPPVPRVDADGFALPVPARTVPKDEMGYPIVAKNRNAPVLPEDNGDDGNQI